MLPKLAHFLFGDAWRTSVASLCAALLYGATSVPAILDGTATSADYRRAGIAAALFLIGRFSADAPKAPQAEKSKKPKEEEVFKP